MVSNEETPKHNPGLENQPCDKKILVLSRDTDREFHSTSIANGGWNKADRIRGVTRSLVMDALAILDKMRDNCQKSQELQEDYYQLYHCLDYLKRFCDGKV